MSTTVRVNRTARKMNTEAWSSAFFTTTNVAPQRNEQNASDRSARKRLLIGPFIRSRDRELAVYWLLERTDNCPEWALQEDRSGLRRFGQSRHGFLGPLGIGTLGILFKIEPPLLGRFLLLPQGLQRITGDDVRICQAVVRQTMHPLRMFGGFLKLVELQFCMGGVCQSPRIHRLDVQGAVQKCCDFLIVVLRQQDACQVALRSCELVVQLRGFQESLTCGRCVVQLRASDPQAVIGEVVLGVQVHSSLEMLPAFAPFLLFQRLAPFFELFSCILRN